MGTSARVYYDIKIKDIISFITLPLVEECFFCFHKVYLKHPKIEYFTHVGNNFYFLLNLKVCQTKVPISYVDLQRILKK